ncbi:MAG: TerC family protein [Haliscomenobacteraceae bacterium CHB4]|nr:TerC family protein [Haliscomenobacteraceae bacterium CHB4]
MFLLAMPDFSSGEVWISLLTLTFLEIVLGVDNIIFLSIISNKLPAADQPKARNIGLILAMVLRIVLLFGITWVMSLNKVLLPLDFLSGWDESHPGEHAGLTGQGLILFVGGLFLLWKATTEIHHKLESPQRMDDPQVNKGTAALNQVILQIALINLVFSFDSILTAVGLSDNLIIMIVAVVVSVLVMMIFSGPVSTFVNNHPTVQMLGLSFLILIGFSLVAESAHSGHLLAAEVPKGYLYFAIFFSLFVEVLNIRMRKAQKPVQLHGPAETAKREGILDDNILDMNK